MMRIGAATAQKLIEIIEAIKLYEKSKPGVLDENETLPDDGGSSDPVNAPRASKHAMTSTVPAARTNEASTNLFRE
jgi:hypothetical protein